MAIKRELKNINQFIEEREAKKSAGFKRTEWLKIEDKESVRVVFLQELDEDSENYSEKNGLGALVQEHTSPLDWKKRAECTLEDEGQCLGCEKHREDYKAGWKARPALAINVLVLKDDGEHEVKVLKQGLSGQAITPALLEHAGELEKITDKVFKISRRGLKTDSTYTLTALKEHDLNVEDYELFNLDDVVFKVPYALQAAHYGIDGSAVDSSSADEDFGAAPARFPDKDEDSSAAPAQEDEW